jgi:hypothetical protein
MSMHKSGAKRIDDTATQVDSFSELNGSNPGTRTPTATGSQHSGFKHHNYMNDKGE